MDLQQYINECKKHWRWFAATLTTALIAAILFLLMFAPRYERSATVLIKDGVIAARDLRGDALSAKIEELLK